MRVLVCGGRDYTDNDRVDRLLEQLFCPHYPDDTDGSAGTWLPPPDLVLVTGDAPGADRMASDWGVVNWVKQEFYPADWPTHGKAAGPIRNQQMLDTGIDLVVAFPGGRGTADMIARATKARVPVLSVPA